MFNYSSVENDLGPGKGSEIVTDNIDVAISITMQVAEAIGKALHLYDADGNSVGIFEPAQ